MQEDGATGTLVVEEFALRQVRGSGFGRAYGAVMDLAARCPHVFAQGAGPGRGCPRAMREACMALSSSILSSAATVLLLRELAQGGLPLASAARELSGAADALADHSCLGDRPGLTAEARALFRDYAAVRAEVARYARIVQGACAPDGCAPARTMAA